MGRFYQTSDPQNLDFMFKLPETIMYKAVEQASKDIEENQAYMLSLYDQLELNALDPDKEKANEILDKYEQKINDISKVMQERPLDFRSKTGELVALGRNLKNEFTRGQAAAIASNYAAHKKAQEMYQDMYAKGKLQDPESAMRMMQWNLEQYKKQGGVGYDSTTGKYNIYNPEQLTPYKDLDKYFADTVAKMKPHIQAYASAGSDGKYIYTERGKREILTKEELTSVMLDRFMGDSDVQNYIRQRSKIGAITGWMDENGRMISPWAPKLDAEGKPIIGKDGQPEYGFNPNSAFANMLQSVADRFDVDNIKEHVKGMSADSYGVARFRQTLTDAGNTVEVADPEASVQPLPFANNAEYIAQQNLLTSQAAKREEFNELDNIVLDIIDNSNDDSFDAGFRTEYDDAVTSAMNNDFTKLESLALKYQIPLFKVKEVKRRLDEKEDMAFNLGTQQTALRGLFTGQSLPDSTVTRIIDNAIKEVDESGGVKSSIVSTAGKYGTTVEDQADIARDLKDVEKLLENVSNWPQGATYYVIDGDSKNIKPMTFTEMKDGGYLKPLETAPRSTSTTNYNMPGALSDYTNTQITNSETGGLKRGGISKVQLTLSGVQGPKLDSEGMYYSVALTNPDGKQNMVYIPVSNIKTGNMEKFQQKYGPRVELDNHVYKADLISKSIDAIAKVALSMAEAEAGFNPDIVPERIPPIKYVIPGTNMVYYPDSKMMYDGVSENKLMRSVFDQRTYDEYVKQRSGN